MTLRLKTSLIGMTLLAGASVHTASAADMVTTEALPRETLTIENFVGTIQVNTVEGGKLEIVKAKNDGSLDLEASPNGLKIDGGIRKPDSDDCESYYGKYNVNFFSKKEKKGQFGGYKNLEDYPILTLNAPRDVDVIIRNSIPFATFGDIGGLDAVFKHCGAVETGNLTGNALVSILGSLDLDLGDLQDLNLAVKGSGDFTGGNARDVEISVMGSGDVRLRHVASADLSSEGSGDIRLENIEGPTRYSSKGSGDFSADKLTGHLVSESLGSGDFTAESLRGDLFYKAGGSGDLDLDELVGDVSITARGSGDVRIEDGTVDTLFIKTSGSSHIEFRGTAETADLTSHGSGSIRIERVNGRVTQNSHGSGEIKISKR